MSGSSDSPIVTPTSIAEEARAAKAQRDFGVWCQFRAICKLSPRTIGSLLFRTFNDWSADGASRLGAALSYYTLFSIAPILVVITGVASFFIGQAAVHGQIAPWLERLLSPEGSRAAELLLQRKATPTGGIVTTVVGVVSVFLATSVLVNELRQSMNIVWRVPPSASPTMVGELRAMLSDRIHAFLIVVGAGLLIIASLVVNTAVAAAGAYLHAWLPVPESVLQAINFLVSFLLTTTVFMLVYKMVPDAHVAWGDAWVGALVTAFLFAMGGMVLSIYLGKAAATVYGTATSVLALLVWVYYSAQVFFFGAELTRIFATDYGGGIVPRRHSLRSLVRLYAPSGEPVR